MREVVEGGFVYRPCYTRCSASRYLKAYTISIELWRNLVSGAVAVESVRPVSGYIRKDEALVYERKDEFITMYLHKVGGSNIRYMPRSVSYRVRVKKADFFQWVSAGLLCPVKP